jgi:hypothetical protein
MGRIFAAVDNEKGSLDVKRSLGEPRPTFNVLTTLAVLVLSSKRSNEKKN